MIKYKNGEERYYLYYLDITFSNILLDKKLYENISVYDISYKTSMGLKSLHIRFDKIDGSIRIRGGEFRFLVFFYYELFHEISDKIKVFYE